MPSYRRRDPMFRELRGLPTNGLPSQYAIMGELAHAQNHGAAQTTLAGATSHTRISNMTASPGALSICIQ